jgi:DNA-binding CsgD family transcriptional regulator
MIGITRREKEVLCLLARGLADKEIASELNLSPYTVGNHLRNICAKIGKSIRGEAVHWAVSSGLITLE